jgi:rubredoxin
MSKVHRVVDPANWIWQGRFACRHCGSEFTPERGDPGLVLREDEFDVHCPVCDADNRFRRGPLIATGPAPEDPQLESHQASLLGSMTGFF